MKGIKMKMYQFKAIENEVRALQNQTIKKTEGLFIYAGHLMAIKLTQCPDVHVETVSVAHRDVYENGENLGVYPKYFAECEAMDIINDRVSDFKDAGQTLEGTEAIVRNVIAEFIKVGIFTKGGAK